MVCSYNADVLQFCRLRGVWAAKHAENVVYNLFGMSFRIMNCSDCLAVVSATWLAVGYSIHLRFMLSTDTDLVVQIGKVSIGAIVVQAEIFFQ